MAEPRVILHRTGQTERILIVDRADDGWTMVRQLTRQSISELVWNEARIVCDPAMLSHIADLAMDLAKDVDAEAANGAAVLADFPIR
jgi:hypothetical protein